MSTIRKPSSTSARPGTPGQRVSHGLVALSSAVVMAVYSAGYLRTQAAADRFAAEAGQRRPVVPAPAPEVAGASEGTAPAVDEPRPTPAAAAPVTPAASTPVPIVAKATTVSSAPATAAPVAAPRPMPTPAGPAANATPAATSAAPIAEATPVAAAAAPSPATTATSVAATTANESATPAKPRYKDGTYTGWGTSRHGDIEAQVIIVNGRITSATIAQCWTRWPCSWIEALPGQVVARQSPETDFVSGATQSTNAFYYAVVQALGKAALP